MKKSFLHITRLVTFLVALQILNLNLFVQDSTALITVSSTANTSANDDDEIDSVVEYISEVVVKKIKSIHNRSSTPNKHLQAHKHFGVKMIEVQPAGLLLTQAGFSTIINSGFLRNYQYRYSKEIADPPLAA